jgi:hypothetical protein
MDIFNTVVGATSLILGGFAIWLSLHFYERSKESEKQVALLLEGIRTQTDSLQKLTGRWMDRFTRHATEPKPVDEGLMALVSAVADLPTTILTTLRVTPAATNSAQPQVEQLVTELISTYIALHYYSAVANVAMQTHLPAATEYDETNTGHVAFRRLIDSTAVDFQFMANSINTFDRDRVQASRLASLLQETNRDWAPLVRTADGVFRFREEGGA